MIKNSLKKGKLPKLNDSNKLAGINNDTYKQLQSSYIKYYYLLLLIFSNFYFFNL